MIYIQVLQKYQTMSHILSLKSAGTLIYNHITSAGKSSLNTATQSKAHTK